MVNNTLSTYRQGCFTCLLILGAIIFLSSCTTTKDIHTARVNTDSLVNEEKRKLTEIHNRQTAELHRQIEEMTSSGVTFLVDSCPERDAVLALLDSTGRANYEKAKLQDRVKSLNNKVTISEKGLITAEGNIKEARFTSKKVQEENLRLLNEKDSLIAELEKKDTHVVTEVKTKDKDVKRTSPIPWILFILACVASGFLGWWAHSKISISRINTTNMKSLLFIFSLFTLASCDSHDKPTDNISFGQAWSYATGVTSYWVWVIIALVGATVGGYFLRKLYRSGKWSGGHTALVLVLVALVFVALLATPASIAANTTMEQAARGVYIR